MNNSRGFFARYTVTPRCIIRFVLLFFMLTTLLPTRAFAGALLLSPNTGSFTVGSTFDVQVLLDTEDKSVNALDIDLRFPPSQLQLVSPHTNVSVISLWTSQPEFNNLTGRVRLQGGIPRGINVGNALVATLTFRVKSVGPALLTFSDNSKVLLNDGLGTNDFSRQENAIYTLLLPPPAGPIVVSETHPDQSIWYANSSVILKWATNDPVQSYSYIFDEEPVSKPDEIGEGSRSSVLYKNVPDGRHYFHIKSLREGAWGGVTHFAVNIDVDPPAEFPLDILPGLRTNARDIVVKWSTTDTLSGLDHYELRTVSLQPQSKEDGTFGNQPLFIEVESPYIISHLEKGSYDIFVRAYDKSGNYREVVRRVTITDKYFGFTSRDGLIIGPYTISWWWIIALLLLGIIVLAVIAKHFKNKHDLVHARTEIKVLPESVNTELEELKKYREKYGGTLLLLFLVGSMIVSAFSSTTALGFDEGDTNVELSPPYVTTLSKNVSNNEIFYIGGKTDTKDVTVSIFMQNLLTGETMSHQVSADKKGEWFYRHNGFLSPGKYVIWTQGHLGDVISPPSPQMEMIVERAAIVFGVTRVSYEAIYFMVTIALSLIIVLLVLYTLYHMYHHRMKHRLLLKEVHEAEESIRRGFAVIRRDIERELATLKKGQLGRPLTTEEKYREDELYRDLKDTERRIGKEVWDIEQTENRD